MAHSFFNGTVHTVNTSLHWVFCAITLAKHCFRPITYACLMPVHHHIEEIITLLMNQSKLLFIFPAGLFISKVKLFLLLLTIFTFGYTMMMLMIIISSEQSQSALQPGDLKEKSLQSQPCLQLQLLTIKCNAHKKGCPVRLWLHTSTTWKCAPRSHTFTRRKPPEWVSSSRAPNMCLVMLKSEDGYQDLELLAGRWWGTLKQQDGGDKVYLPSDILCHLQTTPHWVLVIYIPSAFYLPFGSVLFFTFANMHLFICFSIFVYSSGGRLVIIWLASTNNWKLFSVNCFYLGMHK